MFALRSILAFFVLFGFSQAFAADVDMTIHQAAKQGELSRVKELLRAGANIDSQDSQGYTPLIFAAYYGHQSVVNFLLEKGANPCLKDHRGNSATLGAIFKGHLGVAKKLIQSKCPVNQVNEAGQTPLMFASLFGREDIAKVLLKAGADPAIQDINGFDAKKLAEGQGNGSMLQILNGK